MTKLTIDCSTLGIESNIIKFIQASSNEILLETFCLGFYHKKNIERLFQKESNITQQQHLIPHRSYTSDQKLNIFRQNAVEYDKTYSLSDINAQTEEMIREKLLGFFPDSSIENMKIGTPTDSFIFNRYKSPIHILITVKNYIDKNIPTVDVDKFKRDLQEYDAGILMSLNTGIVGYACIKEEIQDNKIITYIPRADITCFSLYYSIMFIEMITRYEHVQKAKHLKITEQNKKIVKLGCGHLIDEKVLDAIIIALSPIKRIIEHYKGLCTALEKSGIKITKEVDAMVNEVKSIITNSQHIIQDTVDSVIEGCKNREAPQDIIQHEHKADMLIYNNREEEINTKVGIFIIKICTNNVVVYEKSTSVQVQTFRHRKTKKSELAAYQRCKDVIDEINEHKSYTPPKPKAGSARLASRPFIPALAQTK